MNSQTEERWSVEIAGMPHFDQAMDRIYAWFEGEIIDRPPVRFSAHNAFVEQQKDYLVDMTEEERRALWFDAEYQLDMFERSIEGRVWHGETFPVFSPNLGPDVYAAFFAGDLIFGEVTSWIEPTLKNWNDMDALRLDMDNVYSRKIDELTMQALERCPGKYLVGYTDLHPGLDCCVGWRGPQQLCLDMYDSPENVHKLADLAISGFETVYDHYDDMLKARGQLSVNWMGIPTFGRMHVPSCDFAALISPPMFEEFGLPLLQREVKTMTHNIFHIDGKGVARHRDAILSVPEVHAIQWVQGMGHDLPIMQWVPLIKEIQARAPIIIDLNKAELDDFMEAVEPEGIFLWIATESEEEELDLLDRIAKW
jgi:hypothetical protein